MDLATLIIAAGLPSAICGVAMGLVQHNLIKRLEKAEKAHTEAEERREKGQIMLIDSVNASIKLSETIAEGCKKSGLSGFNGNVEEAMQYADDIRREQDRYYRDMGIRQVYN
jgi:hypothetical protein